MFAYLEAVAPDGRVTYLTEGQLRLIHRKSMMAEVAHRPGLVPRTFSSADTQQMVPGEASEISFDLLPISAVLREGYKIRLAIAGADAGTFPSLGIVAGETHTVSIYRSASRPSRIDIPVADTAL